MSRPLKIVLITLLVASVLGIGIYSYIKLHTGATASAKKNRRLKFKRIDTSNFSNAVGDSQITSGDSIILVPSLNEAFFNDTQLTTVKLKLATIENTYGKYINNSAVISNVSPEIIKAFIFVESSGKANAVSPTGCCFGLMQISPATAKDIIAMENRKGRLNDKEKAIIKKYKGSNANFSNLTITKEDLFKPELNILIGTIFIGILIDEEITDKVTDILGYENDWLKGQVNPIYKTAKFVRMEFVIARYNGGYYKWSSKPKPVGTTTDVCTKTGSCEYIKKILGTNGVLTILT